MESCGISSGSVVVYQLKLLVVGGFITRDRYVARSLLLTAEGREQYQRLHEAVPA